MVKRGILSLFPSIIIYQMARCNCSRPPRMHRACICNLLLISLSNLKMLLQNFKAFQSVRENYLDVYIGVNTKVGP